MRISDWSSDVCSSDLTSDAETFQVCTDTIVRHVGDIGRMVDEFSSFARMPAPVMRREDIGRLVEQAVFLQRTAQPQVQFGYTPPQQPLVVPCDGRQVSRSEEHTPELPSLMRNSHAVVCLNKKHQQ